ncbi:OmpA family protein [Marinicella gelatinilytica]|uniref:OmpA family protein n=1 Tax=Marinicella gelatinilytica TaxID=2996017 RepID=UPI002260FC19|nr:OmpA family protein [Marinicella gelatinilytica]MCX7545985.1 OmpA family protein [Marinicella gelatinilytica]
MYLSVNRTLLLFSFFMCFTTQVVLAQSKTYPDGHGGEVTFPQGDVSFADEVIYSDTGSEQPVKDAGDPEEALGPPNYKEGNKRGYVSLGCSGELILKFTDNQLIDIPGPDLYVFEVGPAIEPTALAVSNNNKDWVGIGQIEGGKSEIDIAPYVDSDMSFRYVKLIDLKEQCGGDTPGADIDAVGAIGSLQHIALDSSVLFNTGKYQLKSEASKAIADALANIDQAQIQSVIISGHTDNVGSAESNQELSKNRAQSVADYLIAETGIEENKITIQAHGESDPIASNETEESRSKNRRVELSIRSIATETAQNVERIRILGIWRSKDNRQTTLRQTNDTISGEYTQKGGGQIIGEFTDETVFEGFWIKKSSSQTCKTEKAGSKYWGKLLIQFDSPNRDVFDAKWSYCDAEKWQGNWQQANRIL